MFSHPLRTRAGEHHAVEHERNSGKRKGSQHCQDDDRHPPQDRELAFNGGNNACTNLINVAANAKAQGILVIMLGYNMFENGQPKRCSDYDGVKDDYSNLNVSSPRDSVVASRPAPR